MAIQSIRTLSELENGFILAPERYDPRRLKAFSAAACKDATELREVATLVRGIVCPGKLQEEGLLVLDTSNAQEGVVINSRPPVRREEIGSAKKTVSPGDVIISRLRP
jgi:hypothetical protein